MSNTTTQGVHRLRSEISRLEEELHLRDQLVQQLSQELFRLVKSQGELDTQPAGSERQKQENKALREQLQEVEQQVSFYQQQIQERDQQIYQLRQSVQELTDRTRMLEQVVQELPQIYRRKFAERMMGVRDRVEQLQRENRQLHAELHSVNYRLAVKNRRNVGTAPVNLPAFSPKVTSPIPTFGTV